MLVQHDCMKLEIKKISEHLSGANDSQPVQAYVVESNISNAQALQQELETQATL